MSSVHTGISFGFKDKRKSKAKVLPVFQSALADDESSSEDLVKQAALLVQQGNTMAESGNFKAAIVKWRDSVLYAPNPKILEQMAQAHIMLGNDFGAIQTASHAHELDPLWAPALITLARAQRNFGEYEMALKSMSKAVFLNPCPPDEDLPLMKEFQALRRIVAEGRRRKLVQSQYAQALKKNPGATCAHVNSSSSSSSSSCSSGAHGHSHGHGHGHSHRHGHGHGHSHTPGSQHSSSSSSNQSAPASAPAGQKRKLASVPPTGKRTKKGTAAPNNPGMHVPWGQIT